MYLYKGGVNVVEVEEERKAENREQLALPHTLQLLLRLVVAQRNYRVEENIVRPWNGDRTDDIIGAQDFVPFHGLGQLPPSLSEGCLSELLSLQTNSLFLFRRRCHSLLLAGPRQHLHNYKIGKHEFCNYVGEQAA